MTLFIDWLARIGRPCYGQISSFGEFFRFCYLTFYWMFRRPWRGARLSQEMNAIGVNSTMIIFLVALFSGMVFALQTGSSFRIFGAETLVGSTVGVAMTRELAPVFTALMMIARAGSGMAAQSYPRYWPLPSWFPC